MPISMFKRGAKFKCHLYAQREYLHFFKYDIAVTTLNTTEIHVCEKRRKTFFDKDFFVSRNLQR